MIRSGLRFTLPADCDDSCAQTRLAEFRQTYIGEYRLLYDGYDVSTHELRYSIVFDNPAEHTAFILRYQ
jgi:hypothetical protein